MPYGDPAPTHWRKNAFDVGEYGMGMLRQQRSSSAATASARSTTSTRTVNDSRGEPLTIKNAICMHEEDYGILWKHTDRRTGQAEVRRSRRLVVSSISTVGNYEYGFFWYLYQDGTIQFEVKLTGVLSTGACGRARSRATARWSRPAALRPEPPALLQRPARLDLDGAATPSTRSTPRPVPPGRTTRTATPVRPRRRCWTESRGAAAHRPVEAPLLEDRQPERAQRARASRSATSSCPGDNSLPLASRRASQACDRAGFVNKHLWVTPVRPERAVTPAGDYPNQSRAATGCREYARRTGRSRTPTSCSGTPSAHTTSRGRRTSR